MVRKMKSSGIEWIGEIPEDWNKIKIKYATNEIKKGISPNYTENEYTKIINQATFSKGFFDIENIRYVNNDFYTSKGQVKKNDVLLATTGGGVLGKTYYFNEDGEFLASTDVAYVRVNMNKLVAKFLYYCLSINYVMFNDIMANGSTNQTHFDMPSLFNMFLPLPNIETQNMIVDYLDKKCTEIDLLLADIHSQIKILEDYKKSVITEAVTKGLNPDVEMKDSGIEWIGEVPNHWIIDRIKNHLKRNEPKNPGNMRVLSVYREYGVIPKDSRDDNHNVTSEDTSKYKYVKEGNLVINKMKAWQGSLAVSQYEGIVSPAYFIYEFTDKNLDKRYFHHLIRGGYKDEFRRVSGGIREGQWDLSSEEFSKTLILLPPIEEQKKIAVYLDKKCAEIEGIIIEKKKQLKVLEQYKKSLIYEYVTGKKEVYYDEL